VVDVAMNAHGVTVERRLGRPVMSGFHAMYSLGGTAGAVLGALAAGAGLGRTHHFLLIVLAGIAVAVPATGMLLPSGADAAGVATFTAAMTAGRLAGDRVAARLGPVTAFRSGALLAGIGFGAALLVGTPLAGLAGLGLLGGGLSLTFPLAVSAAGRSNGAAATAVARVSTLGYLGAFVGPGLIGALAGPFGLPAAVALPAVLVTGAALAARLVAPPQARPVTPPARAA
jgi:hypothetical protein